MPQVADEMNAALAFLNRVIAAFNAGDTSTATDLFHQFEERYLDVVLRERNGPLCSQFIRLARFLRGGSLVARDDFRNLTWSGTYSQGQEDQVLDAVFRDQGAGTYIDVGANHPRNGNNTYRLYERGWRGLCLDPLSEFAESYASLRPEDTFLAVAAGREEGVLPLHLSDEGDVYASLQASNIHGSSRDVPVRRLRDLCEAHGIPKAFDVLSLDTEGTEIEVLEGLDLDVYRPRLILAEYNTNNRVSLDLQRYFLDHGYQVLQMTYYNVIATRDLEADFEALHPRRL